MVVVWAGFQPPSRLHPRPYRLRIPSVRIFFPLLSAALHPAQHLGKLALRRKPSPLPSASIPPAPPQLPHVEPASGPQKESIWKEKCLKMKSFAGACATCCNSCGSWKAGRWMKGCGPRPDHEFGLKFMNALHSGNGRTPGKSRIRNHRIAFVGLRPSMVVVGVGFSASFAVASAALPASDSIVSHFLSASFRIPAPGSTFGQAGDSSETGSVSLRLHSSCTAGIAPC